MDFLFFLLPLAIFIVVAVGMFKTFSKMGYDNAWMLFIPIANIIFMLKFIDKPIWWVIGFFIPIVGGLFALYVVWLVSEKVAKAYSKSTGFAVGLLLLGFVFYPILGFGPDTPSQAG